ncbi:hypothetical protein HK102_003672, partial [Quaeritorhiza haematococci]
YEAHQVSRHILHDILSTALNEPLTPWPLTSSTESQTTPPSLSTTTIQTTFTKSPSSLITANEIFHVDSEAQTDPLPSLSSSSSTSTSSSSSPDSQKDKTQIKSLQSEVNKLHEEITQLRLHLAAERTRRDQVQAERDIMEYRLIQLARVSHKKLVESINQGKVLEHDVLTLQDQIAVYTKS